MPVVEADDKSKLVGKENWKGFLRLDKEKVAIRRNIGWNSKTRFMRKVKEQLR